LSTSLILTICLFIAIFFIWNTYLLRVIIVRLPFNYPNPENRQKKAASKQSLVCFGDSNTHGNVSYDWVGKVRNELLKMTVFNAGINADLTFSLLRRIDEIILIQPDFITILIRTNDVNAVLSEKNLKRYIERNKIQNDESPSEELFVKNYSNILTQLKNKTNAHIALVSIPLLSEDLSARSNKICHKYSEHIETLSKQFEIDLLDLRKGQIELVTNNYPNQFWSISKSRIMINISMFLHYTFGLSWTSIGNIFGNQTSPDNIHLNEKTGNILSELVLNWINKKEKQ